MAPQPVYLIAQRLLGDLKVLCLPTRPALPEIAAAPSCHHQDSLAVSDIEELLGFQLSLQAHRVQAQVLYVAEFVTQPLRVLAQHHVRGPPASADQNILAVDVKLPPANGVEIRSDLANSELGARMIAYGSIHLELHGQLVQIRCPHLRQPPQPRI